MTGLLVGLVLGAVLLVAAARRWPQVADLVGGTRPPMAAPEVPDVPEWLCWDPLCSTPGHDHTGAWR